MTPGKLTRRAALLLVATDAVTVAAHVVEQEQERDDIRPVLPFSEDQARWLLGPIVPQPKVPHE